MNKNAAKSQTVTTLADVHREIRILAGLLSSVAHEEAPEWDSWMYYDEECPDDASDPLGAYLALGDMVNRLALGIAKTCDRFAARLGLYSKGSTSRRVLRAAGGRPARDRRAGHWVLQEDHGRHE